MLFKLFCSFFQIGLFSVGGGYAAMPLIEEQAVRLHGWLTMAQFADIMTIAEMTPGPIAINAATFVGIQTAGILGALAATAGCVCPSCVIVLLMAAAYERWQGKGVLEGILSGLRPAVVAMIASAGLSLVRLAVAAQGQMDVVGLLLFAGSFAMLRIKRCSPITVMLSAGAVGAVLYSIM